jgi:hypothetical protein
MILTTLITVGEVMEGAMGIVRHHHLLITVDTTVMDTTMGMAGGTIIESASALRRSVNG